MPPNAKKPPDKIWYPSLLQSANNIKTNSWFNMTEINNKVKKNTKITINKKIEYLKTIKIAIYPNDKQQKLLKVWFNDVLNIYNQTNEYIKNTYEDDKNILNFIKLRNALNPKIKELNELNKLNKHTLDYSVKHCLEMYKSAISNSKKTNKSFEIKNLSMERNRFNMVIEPTAFSSKINGFFINTLGYMESDISLINKFDKNCILQYQKNNNRYYILAPVDSINYIGTEKYKKCGIDLGVRTFGTLYSPEKVIEIGNNTKPILKNYYKKIDSAKSSLDKKLIKEKLYKKIIEKQGNKIRNKIEDLHKKVSVYLTSNYNEIIIGKMSTKSMVSNEKSKIREITKRMLMTLQFYKFNEVLENMSKKYGSKIIFINEYKTSMTCHNCKNENKELGGNHVYKCLKCKIELGRDINASINIYNNGIVKC